MKRFWQDDSGIALTEYLVVLGILLGGVVVAVLAFGTAVEGGWQNWATWLTSGPPSP